MKNLINTEAESTKSVAYKKRRVAIWAGEDIQQFTGGNDEVIIAPAGGWKYCVMLW